jgi:hypothetical protein
MGKSMRLAWFSPVLIVWWGATLARQSAAAEADRPPQTPARAVIGKIFHEQRPAQSPPRLMRDVIGNADVDWNAAALRAAKHQRGEEFLLTWTASATENLVIRFEYRQVNETGVKMQQQSNPKLRGRSLFSVKGGEFQTGGAVTAWRVTIWEGEKVLASRQSFMW